MYCTAYKHRNDADIPVLTRAPPSKPFEEVSLDTLYLIPEEDEACNRISKILIMACTFSGFVQLIPIHDETVEQIETALDKIFSSTPAASRVLLDNGKYFVSLKKYFADLSFQTKTEIEMHFTTPYLHRSNPVERANRNSFRYD